MQNEKSITIEITKYLFDKLADIAKEYDIDPEILAVIAIQKLLEDIDFIRNLRSGKHKTL